MSTDKSHPIDQSSDDDRLENLPARPADSLRAANKAGGPGASIAIGDIEQDGDVIRIEDLAPRENVKGGRKVILGEVATRPDDQK